MVRALDEKGSRCTNGITGGIVIDYYNFARELKIGKPISQLIEKYAGRGCERKVLEEIARVIRQDPKRRL